METTFLSAVSSEEAGKVSPAVSHIRVNRKADFRIIMCEMLSLAAKELWEKAFGQCARVSYAGRSFLPGAGSTCKAWEGFAHITGKVGRGRRSALSRRYRRVFLEIEKTDEPLRRRPQKVYGVSVNELKP
ncbi:MAG: hypothetical protein WBM78_17815, partial [Desulfobacterales bacterium]